MYLSLDQSLLITQPAQAAALAAALMPAPAAPDSEDAGQLIWAWADPLKQWVQGAAGDTHAQHLLQAADQTRPPRQNPAGRCDTVKRCISRVTGYTHLHMHACIQQFSFITPSIAYLLGQMRSEPCML